MKSLFVYSFKLILPMLFLVATLTISAQDARLHFEKLSKLENNAADVVESKY